MIDEEHAKKLALFGITLKNETSSHAILQLKNSQFDSKTAQPLYKSLLSSIDSYKLNSIKLPSITFGVELEFVGYGNLKALCDFNMSMTKLLRDKYFYTGKYSHNDGEHWILGKDGSIKFNALNDEFGYELSTAKLNLFNEYDAALFKSVLECVDHHLHGRVNNSCGTHIHLGIKYDGLYRNDVRQVLQEYSCMEEIAFDPLVPSNRRRNSYCKTTQPIISEKYQKLSARYCDFNEWSFVCDKLRFESRQLEGTLDFQTILNWATLQSYVIYDLVSHASDRDYIRKLLSLDAFHVLFRYDLSSDCINFFLDRIFQFRSRKLLAHCKSCI